jgi:hypothetical protein
MTRCTDPWRRAADSAACLHPRAATAPAVTRICLHAAVSVRKQVIITHAIAAAVRLKRLGSPKQPDQRLSQKLWPGSKAVVAAELLESCWRASARQPSRQQQRGQAQVMLRCRMDRSRAAAALQTWQEGAELVHLQQQQQQQPCMQRSAASWLAGWLAGWLAAVVELLKQQ